MNTLKIISLVGARPQFIKVAPVSAALRRAGYREIIVHTGQHYDSNMSATFFDELGISAPDYNLGIGSAAHGAQTGRMLEAIEKVLLSEQPDWLVVFGDTNSTLAGALAAAKLHIRVAHVEAGLRSFNRAMPEEINRVLTDHISDALFCPTANARKHLAHEGITRGVEVVGDVMFDVLAQARPSLAHRAATLLPELGVVQEKYVLVTIHRASNTDNPETLRQIVRALGAVEWPMIFPIHPRTRALATQYQIAWPDNFQVIDPLGYLDMLTLLSAAYRVSTDSGGLQKEAYLLGVPCVTLRDETEWPETVEAGWNQLVGDNPVMIAEAFHRSVPPAPSSNPFGDGHAADRIAAALGR